MVAKGITGALVLIGIYLIVTNPKGASTAENSLSSGGTSIIKALQGR